MEHHILISKQATTQLILNGFEAFVVQHNGQRRSGIEIHASVYGTVKQGKTKTKYQVEFISVDTTADMQAGSVAIKGETQYLKEHLAKQIGFERIGRIWLITSCRSANNIMPITFFLPAFIASFFYSA